MPFSANFVALREIPAENVTTVGQADTPAECSRP